MWESLQIYVVLVLTLLWEVYTDTFDKFNRLFYRKPWKFLLFTYFCSFWIKLYCYSIGTYMLQAPLFNSRCIYIKEQSYRAFHIFLTCFLRAYLFFLNLGLRVRQCNNLSRKKFNFVTSFWSLSNDRIAEWYSLTLSWVDRSWSDLRINLILWQWLRVEFKSNIDICKLWSQGRQKS